MTRYAGRMPRRKAPIIEPPRDTSADEALLRDLYRRDPCRILPHALWKSVADLQHLEARFIREGDAVTGVELRQPGRSLVYGTRTQDPLKAASVKLDGMPTIFIHNDFVKPLIPWFSTKEARFRLVHRGSDLPLRQTAPGFSVREVDVKTELPLVATILHACCGMPAQGTDELTAWTRRPVFDPHVWLWVLDRKEKRSVAVGIAEVDRLTGEGSLTTVQVLPAFRGRGVGTMLIQELLYRLQQKVSFTTVEGDVRGQDDAERLFRTCGFTGRDVWWVLRR
jgi:ribosomal protein S18 acetylase RimI-like enzyme